MLDALSTAGPDVDWTTEPGLLAYPVAIAAMEQRVAGIRAGIAGQAVWLVEHPPLYTAGTSARPADLRDPQRLPTHRAGRGGQWTYHGPGQRVAYVMLDLQRPHGSVPARDVRAFVFALEAWVIRTLACFGVAGERRQGRVGIWVADPTTGRDEKIGAIGVRVTRWVSWHGLALNVVPDLTHFDGIVPCGLPDHGITSLRALGIDADLSAVDAALEATWDEIFR